MNINHNIIYQYIIYQCSQSTMNHKRDFTRAVNRLMEEGVTA